MLVEVVDFVSFGAGVFSAPETCVLGLELGF